MNSLAHQAHSTPVRYTIQITTNQIIRPQPIRRSILAIDSDPVFLQLITHALSKEYHVLIAHDLEEAINIVRRGRFELLLLDLSMPLCNGIDLLEKIRRHPRLREIPLLALSTSAGLRRHLMDLDMVGVLPKARWLDDLGMTVAATMRLADEQPIEPNRPEHVEPTLARKENARL